MNILFICTGNTCRSAMAAAMMDKIAVDRNLDIRIESAGLCAPDGRAASENAIRAARAYGADLSNHRAKTVTKELIDASDLILTMTSEHKRALEPMASGKVFTLAEYVSRTDDVPDPYGESEEVYKKCADMIYALLVPLADKLEGGGEKND